MSTPEIGAGLQSYFPPGKWTLVLRLSDVAYEPLNDTVKTFLDGFVSGATQESVASQVTSTMDTSSGVMYYRYDSRDTALGTALIAEALPSLLHGVEVLDLNLDVRGRIDRTDEISPERPIFETFPYMRHDVTNEVRDIRQELSYTSYVVDDSAFEELLDH